MKKIKYLIIIMLFIGIKNIYAFDNTIKVYDYAQVLTNNEEVKLKSNIDKYISKNNMDMVIVAVKYYTQTNLDDYMNLFYNKNHFNKDGIILVLDLKNNDTGIKTFGRATNYYSDIEITNILNQMNNETRYYNKVVNFINYSNDYIIKDEYKSNDISILLFIRWGLILITSLLVPTIVIIIGLLKNKKIKKEYDADYYILENSVVINTKKDKFITTNTKKERINK